MKTEGVIVEQREKGIRVLRMNRPDKRNALDAAQWDLLAETAASLAMDPEIRCLILTGAGPTFASGGDLSRFQEEVYSPEGPRKFRERIRRCLDAFHEFPHPTIAMVNGPAIGGGLELALACDIRIAARTATFGMPAVRFGIVMAYPDLVRLASAVGLSWARFLTMTGSVIDAEEACRIGLVHRLADEQELEQVTAEIVAQLSLGEPQAIMWFRDALEFLTDPLKQGLAELRGYEERCLTTESFRQRVERFLKRRSEK